MGFDLIPSLVLTRGRYPSSFPVPSDLELFFSKFKINNPSTQYENQDQNRPKTETEQHWLFPSALAKDNVQANW